MFCSFCKNTGHKPSKKSLSEQKVLERDESLSYGLSSRVFNLTHSWTKTLRKEVKRSVWICVGMAYPKLQFCKSYWYFCDDVHDSNVTDAKA